MPRTPKLKPVKLSGRPSPWMISIPPNLPQSSRRERKYFETKESADTELDRIANRHRTHGEMIDRINSGQLSQALDAFKLIEESGIDAHLPTVVAEWLETHKSRTASISFLNLFNEYLETKND